MCLSRKVKLYTILQKQYKQWQETQADKWAYVLIMTACILNMLNLFILASYLARLETRIP